MDLIEIRELLHSSAGQRLLSYLADFMVETSVRGNSSAEWIKGMGMMIDHLKKIDEKCREQNELKRR